MSSIRSRRHHSLRMADDQSPQSIPTATMKNKTIHLLRRCLQPNLRFEMADATTTADATAVTTQTAIIFSLVSGTVYPSNRAKILRKIFIRRIQRRNCGKSSSVEEFRSKLFFSRNAIRISSQKPVHAPLANP